MMPSHQALLFEDPFHTAPEELTGAETSYTIMGKGMGLDQCLGSSSRSNTHGECSLGQVTSYMHASVSSS